MGENKEAIRSRSSVTDSLATDVLGKDNRGQDAGECTRDVHSSQVTITGIVYYDGKDAGLQKVEVLNVQRVRETEHAV